MKKFQIFSNQKKSKWQAWTVKNFWSWRPFFPKPSPRGWFWKFSKISPTCPKFNTHKKVVVHFFIPMLLLPKTPPLTYPNMKRFKDKKKHHFFHFFTLSLHNGGRRSIAGIAQHSIPISIIKEIPFKIFLSASIFQRNPFKNFFHFIFLVGGRGGVPEPSPLSTSYPHGYQNFQGNLL